jgi:hypothetical protein
MCALDENHEMDSARRAFLKVSAAILLLPVIGHAEGSSGVKLLAGKTRFLKATPKRFVIKTGNEQAAVKVGANAFLLQKNTDVEINTDEHGLIRLVKLVKGGLHSAFDPAQLGPRVVSTEHASLSIRGTAHYCEVIPDKDMTYTCCCYGGVDVKAHGPDEVVEQRTTYHEARVVTAKGSVEAAPYNVPLNHYDDTLPHLEASVGRKPRWQLPDGKMHFYSPDGKLFKNLEQ